MKDEEDDRFDTRQFITDMYEINYIDEHTCLFLSLNV